MPKPWIDISTPLRNGMERWPGDPEVEIDRFLTLENGGGCNATRLNMSAHTGTHVDAPLHYVDGGVPIDRMPIDALVGPATVVSGTEPPEFPPGRVLFRCGTELTAESARYLVAHAVRTVGIDSMSIGNDEVHRILLGGGVWVIEGLNLAAVAPGRYELLCLPLLIENGDGAPARAVLRALT
jgi:arylformamidase